MRILLLFLFIGIAAADENENYESSEDNGEYGHYTTWRKAVCEKHSAEMYQDMLACFQMSDKKVIEVTKKCSEQASPTSKGDIISFMNEACANVQVFHEFDTCFDVYEEDPDFEKLLDVTPEVDTCYENIFEKYAMDSLKGILKNFSSEEEEK